MFTEAEHARFPAYRFTRENLERDRDFKIPRRLALCYVAATRSFSP